jgi:hypothetical protein
VDDGFHPQATQRPLTLGQGLVMGFDVSDFVQARSRRCHQAMFHLDNDFSLEAKVMIDEQIVNGNNRAGQRVFHGGHPLAGTAVLYRRKYLGKSTAGECGRIWPKMLPDGLFRIRAWFSLESNNGLFFFHYSSHLFLLVDTSEETALHFGHVDRIRAVFHQKSAPVFRLEIPVTFFVKKKEILHLRKKLKILII